MLGQVDDSGAARRAARHDRQRRNTAPDYQGPQMPHMAPIMAGTS
jgi:hypothetical protein